MLLRFLLLVFGAITPFCPLALGFQEKIEVSVAPRLRSRPMADSVGMPPVDLRVDVPLVLIPVHVTNDMGSSITGLKQSNFRLLEDNVEQTVTQFAKEDGPVSVGLLFDSSSSMRNKRQKSLEAAAEFFKTANADDEFFLIEFNEKAKLTVPFTRDPNEIYQRLQRSRPFGRTCLIDALHLALDQMKQAQNLRKAIVILSDGGDNRSRFTATGIKQAMQEADVQVYAMGIFDPEAARKTPEEAHGPKLLDELAAETGGKDYPIDNLDDLPMISARIGMELRNQYLLGYAPANTARDGKYRRVKIVLEAPENMPHLRAYHRLGYYAPSQ